jgi:molybdopterin/thiamine biosynthesis adenylyltransferase
VPQPQAEGDRLADPDRINLSNLQRQLVHATGRVGAFRSNAHAPHMSTPQPCIPYSPSK